MQSHRAGFFEALEARALLNAGDLNLAFGGGDGRLLLSQPSGGSVADAVATQPDGKFVLAGSITQSGKKLLWLERLDAKGNPDSTFGSGGISKQTIANFKSSRDIARQSDGKFVVVGETSNGGFIARLTSSGKLDTSFGGGDGIATTNTVLYKLALVPNGKLAAIGQNQRVFEFNSNGTPNTSFGSGGSASFVSSLPNIKSYSAVAINAQADNKLVITATTNETPGQFDGFVGVVRLTTVGKLDKTFSGDGFTTFSISGNDQAVDAAIQSTGRIVIAAFDDNSNTFVTSLNSNGSEHFSKMTNWSASFAEGPHAITVDSSDRIVLAGHTDLLAEANRTIEFALKRFSPEGVEQFTKTIDFSSRDDIARAVGVGGDGNIILVGESRLNDAGEGLKVAIASVQGNNGGPSDKIPVTFDQTHLTVTGTSGNDTIRVYRYGLVEMNGNVNQFPFFGNSFTVNAGGGNDRVEFIGDFSDCTGTLNGGSGNDVLIGATGADVFIGGSGIDTVDYSKRAENLTLSLDNSANDGAAKEHDNVMADVENLIGGSSNDKLVGNPSNNVLKGNGGDDQLFGGAGKDSLDGGAGHDMLFGQDGDDLLLAKEGRTDSLDGGAGFDKAQRDNSASVKDQVLGIEAFV